MTKNDFERLQPGQIIQHKKNNEWAFIVQQNFGDRITCVRTIEVREPVDWEIVTEVKLKELPNIIKDNLVPLDVKPCNIRDAASELHTILVNKHWFATVGIGDNKLTDAYFSPCRVWRYWLLRTWDDTLPAIAYIGLNPSTADEVQNDPTVSRCINFAKSFGCGSMYMLNLFAFRATDPRVMKQARDPIGPVNNVAIKSVSDKCKITVACWGVHGTYLQRDKEVVRLIPNLWCLGVTKGGHPRHPLYLKSDTQLVKL